MATDAPRWIDSGDLNWSPEENLRFKAPDAARRWRRGPEGARQAQRIFPAAANSDAPAARHLAARLAIGIAQGLALFALLRARDLGLIAPYLFSTLSLPLLLAPLLLLEGLGTIGARLLLGWSGIAALVLAGLGFYQRWRIDVPLPAHAGYALVGLSALFLILGQALVHAAARERRAIAAYPTYVRESWSLMPRLIVWALVTGLTWALIGGIGSLMNAAHLAIAPALITMPLTGLISAACFALRWPARLRAPLLQLFTVALPLLVVLSLALIAAQFGIWRAPFWLLTADAALLMLGLNASHGGGPDESAHPVWRKAGEFAAAALIPVLAGLAGAALAARVGQHGWTPNRIFAGAAVFVIVSYGVPYLAAALISLGGGGWMQRIEEPNIALAFAMMAAALALASPLADPMRLAADAQVQRLAAGAATPERFDFAGLARDDARYGYRALQAMTRDANSETARAATLVLAAPPAELLTPTEIGANIAVRTPGAVLPAALLTRDWKEAAGVPPCLTRPQMGCEAWFMDLDGDGRDEILLVYGDDTRWWATAMKNRDGAWNPAGTLAAPACPGALAALRDGRFTLTRPLPGWQDLVIGGVRLNFSGLAQAARCS